MKIAFVIFSGMTTLDFLGVYHPLTRLKSTGFMPDLTWEICAPSNPVIDNSGLALLPSSVGAPLHGYDMVIVPGGLSARTLGEDKAFMDWLRTAQDCPYKVSVCTGSLLLGAAGWLENRRATTHHTAYNELSRFTSKVSTDRIVDEGDLITAGGVTSSIDLGLYLCEKFAGAEVREEIRHNMDYRQSP